MLIFLKKTLFCFRSLISAISKSFKFLQRNKNVNVYAIISMTGLTLNDSSNSSYFSKDLVSQTFQINGIEGISVIIILALVLSLVLITLSYLLSIRKWDAEKLSPYECGFEPFGDARQKFDIRYYLVSLLFILFDLEVSYLFPLIALDNNMLSEWGYIIGAIFIIILTVGFIYEYSKEALDNI